MAIGGQAGEGPGPGPEVIPPLARRFPTTEPMRRVEAAHPQARPSRSSPRLSFVDEEDPDDYGPAVEMGSSVLPVASPGTTSGDASEVPRLRSEMQALMQTLAAFAIRNLYDKRSKAAKNAAAVAAVEA